MAEISVGADYGEVPDHVLERAQPIIDEVVVNPAELEGFDLVEPGTPVIYVNTDGSVSVEVT